MNERHIFAVPTDDPECIRLKGALNSGDEITIPDLPGRWFVEKMTFVAEVHKCLIARFAVVGEPDA